MNFNFHSFSQLFLILGLVAAFNAGCVDQDFDEPPPGGETADLTANKTIAELKNMLEVGLVKKINDSIIIKGVISADDESGNLYKTLVIQDETAAINLRLDQTEMYNTYPVGRELFVNCKGLYLGDYNNLAQLGGGIDADGELMTLPSTLIDTYIFKGVSGQTVEAETISIGDLPDVGSDFEAANLQISKLIKLENVQFIDADSGQPYADAVNQFSENRTLEDCDGNTILVRSSGFADFAAEATPTGKGSVTAILGVFGEDYQLTLRNTDDVDMTASRCGGSTGTETAISIEDLRAAFTGADTGAPNDRKISGIVISDKDNDNITTRNLVLQGSTAGIVVRFDADHSFSLGDEIEVVTTGGTLTEFNGLLQIDGVSNSTATLTGSGTPTSQTVTVSALLASFEDYESELVTIEGATLSGGGTYGDGVTVNDGTGSIALYTRGAATFSGASVPGGTVAVTAIVSQYTDVQLNIRNLDDVTGGTVVTYDLDEDFSGATPDASISLSGWTNFIESGSSDWLAKEFSGDTFAEARGYQSGESDMKTWLVTPSLDLNQDKYVSFDSAQAFWAHDGLTVWISTDFDGSDVLGATWTPLSATLAGQADANYDWVPSGSINLSGYTGSTAHVAFKYTGDETTNTTTYRIDNVKVGNL